MIVYPVLCTFKIDAENERKLYEREMQKERWEVTLKERRK